MYHECANKCCWQRLTGCPRAFITEVSSKLHWRTQGVLWGLREHDCLGPFWVSKWKYHRVVDKMIEIQCSRSEGLGKARSKWRHVWHLLRNDFLACRWFFSHYTVIWRQAERQEVSSECSHPWETRLSWGAIGSYRGRSAFLEELLAASRWGRRSHFLWECSHHATCSGTRINSVITTQKTSE